MEVGSVRGVTAVKRKKVRSRSGYEGAKLDPKSAGGICIAVSNVRAKSDSIDGIHDMLKIVHSFQNQLEESALLSPMSVPKGSHIRGTMA